MAKHSNTLDILFSIPAISSTEFCLRNKAEKNAGRKNVEDNMENVLEMFRIWISWMVGTAGWGEGNLYWTRIGTTANY